MEKDTFNCKNQISFEGKGNLFIEYQKYSEMFASKVRAEIEKITGKIDVDVKSFLLNKGWMNEKGDLLTLAPKRVVIKDGDAYFDEKLIQNADFVFQKGGQLDEKLIAKNITVGGGTNVGVEGELVKLFGNQESGMVTAKELSVRNTKVYGPVYNSGDMYISNSKIETNLSAGGNSIIKNSFISGSLDAYGSSSTTNTRVFGDLELYDSAMAKEMKILGDVITFDSATLDGATIGCELHASNKLIKNVKARSLYLNDKVQVDGNVRGKIRELGKEVEFLPTAKFDRRAKCSLPLSRYKLKFSRSNNLSI